MNKKLKKFLFIYGLAGVLSLSHYFVAPKFRHYEFNPDRVCFEVRECSFNGEKFYIMGEEHMYNFSSSYAAYKLMKNKEIEVLLSEGVKRSPVTRKKISLSERLRIYSYRLYAAATDKKFYSIRDACIANNVPIEFLESDSNDRQIGRVRGMTKFEDIYTAAGSAVYLALAPFSYIASIPFGSANSEFYSKVPKIEKEINRMISRLDRIMAENFVVYLGENDKLALVRVGFNHLDGFLEVMAEKGKLEQRVVSVGEFTGE